MTDYVLKLVLLVPVVAGLAFGSLWLWRKAQSGAAFGQRNRAVRLVDVVHMGTAGRLAVVEFGGRQLLVGISRGRMDLLAGSEPSGD